MAYDRQGLMGYQTLEEALGTLTRADVRVDELLAPHTSWKVGGPADWWLEPKDERDLIEVIAVLQGFHIPWTVLGKGSNTLVADAGYRGAIIHLETGLGASRCIVQQDDSTHVPRWGTC